MHKQKYILIAGAVLLSSVALDQYLVGTHIMASLFGEGGQMYVAKNDGNQGNQGGGQGGGGGNNGNNGGGNGGQGNQGGGQGGGGGNNGNNGGGQGGGGGNNGNNGGGQGGGGGNTARTSGGNGNGGGGGGKAAISGRGLRQHAAALDHVLRRHGVQINPLRTYIYKHPMLHPAAFVTKAAEEAWGENLHQVTCSMFLYLKRLREDRPHLRVDYVDWIVEQTAHALGEDIVEVRAALLGYPHQHEHTSSLLRSISETGCASSNEKFSGEELEDFAAEHAEHAKHVHSAEESPRFTVADVSTDTEIAFQVMDSGAVFTDFGVSHTKEMHLLIVRNDLRHFAHVHPERSADGTWRVPFSAPAGGTYWVYADFVDSDIDHSTVRFERTYEGDKGVTGFEPNMRKTKFVGGYIVNLDIAPYSDGVLFTYHIDDEQGRAPFIEPYLGTMGHGILLSPTGEFIHTHPSPSGDHLTFHLPNNLQGIYRVFTQFKVEGEVLTVEFDWKANGKN